MPQVDQGTGKLLYTDQHIFNESQTRRKNLPTAWIDYKEAYDFVLQSCIIHCLKMFKTSDEVINFIEKTMKIWRVELTAGEKSLVEAKIQRGIFQRDAVSPLLFLISMMPFNHILRKFTGGHKFNKSQEKINHLMYMDGIKLFVKNKKELETLIHAVRICSLNIGMESGIKQRALLIMKSEKRHMMDGMELPYPEIIRTLGEKETYKYLGILEADAIKQIDMKD